jgi:predicted amidohydrolase
MMGGYMFEKIGFFHFGRDWGNPTQALEDKLECKRRAECVADSLMVLPEAFNIGKSFWEAGDCNYDPSVLARLGDIAKCFDVTFVAGLSTNDDRPQSGSPYNSAYLIDRGMQPVLLCRKEAATADYTPYLNGDPNVVQCRGVSIAALICADVLQPYPERHQQLKMELGAWGVLCVPAAMGLGIRDGISSDWSNCWVVLANSNTACTTGSFVSRMGAILEICTGAENEIVLHPMDPSACLTRGQD